MCNSRNLYSAVFSSGCSECTQKFLKDAVVSKSLIIESIIELVDARIVFLLLKNFRNNEQFQPIDSSDYTEEFVDACKTWVYELAESSSSLEIKVICILYKYSNFDDKFITEILPEARIRNLLFDYQRKFC